jgi:hypothetical protein
MENGQVTFRNVLLAVLTATAMAAADETGPSVLTDARYTVLERASRLALCFSGPIRYSVRRNGSTVTLQFSRTQVAPHPGAAQLVFASGDIEGATITPLAGDSLRVEVALRHTEQYTLAQPVDAGMLVMEVPATVPRPAAGDATRAQGGPRVPENPAPASKSSPVDIRGPLRPPLSGPAVIEPPPARSAEGGDDHAVAEQRWSLTVLNGLLAVAIAGGTTCVALFLLWRRQSKSEKRMAAAGGETDLRDPAEPIPERDVWEPPRDQESADRFGPDVKEVWRDPDDQETLEPYDPVAELAERFRRGYDEVGLAVRLHGTPASPLTAETVAKAAGRGGRLTRMNTARKLGVGRGEVDLAIHLKEYEQRHGGRSQ